MRAWKLRLGPISVLLVAAMVLACVLFISSRHGKRSAAAAPSGPLAGSAPLADSDPSASARAISSTTPAEPVADPIRLPAGDRTEPTTEANRARGGIEPSEPAERRSRDEPSAPSQGFDPYGAWRQRASLPADPSSGSPASSSEAEPSGRNPAPPASWSALGTGSRSAE